MSLSDLQFPDGPWESLLKKAYSLLSNLERDGVPIPQWSLGGGTVLMFHYQHRLSKDIDIFIPDPQFLGYVTPRLSDHAENLTTEYDEAAEYVKLHFDEGEIDFIATDPLTAGPFVRYDVLGRSILLETPIEIVAKKIWHRGNRATARDLFDLALVIAKVPEQVLQNKHIFLKHSATFIEQCRDRKEILTPAFEQIQRLSYDKSYDECLALVSDFFSKL